MLKFATERGRHTGLRFVMSLRSSALRCNDFVSDLHPRETHPDASFTALPPRWRVSGELLGNERAEAHDGGAMLRELLFGCSHRFSWPMKRSDGTYYQVCVHCGAEYGYDWERMRRTTATPRQPQASANKGGCIERKSA
jgi:hypothetical protein